MRSTRPRATSTASSQSSAQRWPARPRSPSGPAREGTRRGADGTQHGLDEARRHDEERTRGLAQRGIRVLRFTNDDVM
ncbi:MAG: DUF559 domain-containing protein [Deltaproteobacteria bacterium]|nr:DUF559 domain-containing protein [Deltaproteobacteria bacterium]